MTLPEHNALNLDVGRQSKAKKDGMKSINITFYKNLGGVLFIMSLNAGTATSCPSRCRRISVSAALHRDRI